MTTLTLICLAIAVTFWTVNLILDCRIDNDISDE
jgi:hypothetical protein